MYHGDKSDSVLAVVVLIVEVVYLHENQFSKRYEYNGKYTISFTVYNSKLTPCKQVPHRSSRTYRGLITIIV